jgi:DNA-binding response OmpR family regulator
MAGLPKVLVACCECRNRQALVRVVGQCGLKPVIAMNTREAVSLLGSEAVVVAFCQDDLPGDGFKTVLKVAKRVAVPVVVSSRLADPERYLESMELGAFDYICPPYYSAELGALASAMLHRIRAKPPTSSSSNMSAAT